MNNIAPQGINDNIITCVKTDQNFEISSKDTFYVYSDDLTRTITDVTENEDRVSNYLLSKVGSFKNDEDDILIVTTPINLYNLMVHFQRLIPTLTNNTSN